MDWNKTTLPLLWICLVAFPVSLRSHYRPMIEAEGPPLPPVVEPGPDAALLKVRVIDRATGQQTSATACVNDGSREPDFDPYGLYSLRRSGNRLKGPIRFRPLKPYFYTDGDFRVRVPAGRAEVEVRKGYEYAPCRISLEVAAGDTVELEAALERWIDMAALGWYSGDTHIHMERTGANDDTLLTLTSARGIRYAYLLSMNTRGYDSGGSYESWSQVPGLGDAADFGSAGYYLSSGQEYRTSTLGHVTIVMTRDYVPGAGPTADADSGPSLAVIADQAHALGGFIGLAHGGYHRQEADGLLLASKMDFLELLQFGGYRSLGLDGWYDFLNLGYRLPIVGACDFPYTRELGSEITYAWCEERPTPRSFAAALAEGRSFATSGPMIFLEVSGRRPGEVISLPEAADTTLEVSVRVEAENFPVRYLELVVNGWVVDRELAAEPRRDWRLRHSLHVRESLWVAARAYAEAGTEAHTNPVYIYAGRRLPFNREAARNILARLEGSIEAIGNREVAARLETLKKELTGLLEGRPGSLPRPATP
ncbi:MAG: CehA/McbA family metallohydrolase [Candidatus Glassbacteria bacterium]|nr:CehA/McbA family metallohydrolase [Candidatus Glassbacteria bacterium]